MGLAIFFALFLCAAPGRGFAQEADLGIPDNVAWLGAAAPEGEGGEKKAEKPVDELQVRFWDRLSEDLASVERWRTGLQDVVRYARSRTWIFPSVPKEEAAPLFEEYVDEAENLWNRGMDYWLAMESLRRRYAKFHALGEPQERRAAFLLAYACYLAQARFAVEWTELSEKDPSLVRIFKKPVSGLGLREGSFSALKARARGPDAPGELLALRSYYQLAGGAKTLRRILEAGIPSWTRLRDSDLKALRTGGSFRALPGERALEKLRTGPASSDFPVVSLARPWTETYEAPVSTRTPIFPPQPDWARATASTRAAYAVDTVRHWFKTDGPEGGRPEVLITLQQAAALAEFLTPGDILLVRRERFIGEAGLGGYWHGAGIYVGSPEARRKFFKAEPELERRLADEYNRVSGRLENQGSKKRPLDALRRGVSRSLSELKFWKKMPESAAAPEEEAKASAPEALGVLRSDFDGVALEALSRFAAADAVAALRPRLNRRDLGQALLSAFALSGKPHDYAYDFKTDDAVSSAELLYRAFRSAGEGVRMPLVETASRWSMSTNALARKFDADFGTDRQDLDMVIFLDARESRHIAEASTLEEFRRSWRRPKWTFKGENNEE